MRKCVIAVLCGFSTVACAQGPHGFNLSGDVQGVHDPAIIRQGNRWYVFSTGKAPDGGQIPIRCSDDLKVWHLCGHVFDHIPDWIQRDSPTTRDLWAPDIAYFHGEYRLYYAYSLFGKNTSGIGLATNQTLDSKSPNYKWIDKGLVLRSTAADEYNAIDPNFVVDAQGRSWLDFGSFWSGIKLRRLNDEGKLSAEDKNTYSLAARHHPPEAPAPKPGSTARWQAIEAPFIVHHGSYYYMFVSWDLCCKGNSSTYRIMVGRAREITGPYLDESGTPMLDGGGTELLHGNQSWVGPGGQSVWCGSPNDVTAFHAYGAGSGKPALQISTIDWSDGWPHIALEAHGTATP